MPSTKYFYSLSSEESDNQILPNDKVHLAVLAITKRRIEVWEFQVKSAYCYQILTQIFQSLWERTWTCQMILGPEVKFQILFV